MTKAHLRADVRHPLRHQFRIEEDEVNYRLESTDDDPPHALDSVDMFLGVIEAWLRNDDLTKDDIRQLVRSLRTSRQPEGK